MKTMRGIFTGTIDGLLITMSVLFLGQNTKFTVFGLDDVMSVLMSAIILIISTLISKSLSETWTKKSVWMVFIVLIIVVGSFVFTNYVVVDKPILLNSVKQNPTRGVGAMIVPIVISSIAGVIPLKEK